LGIGKASPACDSFVNAISHPSTSSGVMLGIRVPRWNRFVSCCWAAAVWLVVPWRSVPFPRTIRRVFNVAMNEMAYTTRDHQSCNHCNRKGLTLAEDEEDTDKDEIIWHHVILRRWSQMMYVYAQVIKRRTKITVAKLIALVKKPVLIAYRTRLFTSVSDLVSTRQ
jgi:hypothetical protein